MFELKKPLANTRGAFVLLAAEAEALRVLAAATATRAAATKDQVDPKNGFDVASAALIAAAAE